MGVPEDGRMVGRKATASDVAQEAGVSKWTVNRAFKKDASIAEDSRARIMDAATRLGYRPNLLARSLTTKSTQQVAVLVDDFGNPHKLPMLSLLTSALQQEGLVAVLININEANSHVEAILNADQRQVDAIVLLGTGFRDETLREHALNRAGPPLYVLARESALDVVTAVSCDPVVSMQAIGKHLWKSGYRRPGFLSGPRTLSTALGRMQHFTAFWHAHGVVSVPEIAAGSYDRVAAGRAFKKYWASIPASERVDVVMCENDALAFGAMDVARFEFNVAVPSDLAFVGYDGLELAGCPTYGLTTYQQPMDEMVKHLVAMIVGRTKSVSANLPGRLVVRSST